jgi:RNA polymerase sigma-32 factor
LASKKTPTSAPKSAPERSKTASIGRSMLKAGAETKTSSASKASGTAKAKRASKTSRDSTAGRGSNAGRGSHADRGASSKSRDEDAEDDEEVIEAEAEIVDASGEPVEDDDIDEDDDAYRGEELDDDDSADFTNEKITALATTSKSKSLAAQDPLQAYMREVQAHSLLTPDEEKELAVRYAEHQDVDAAARLVTANLRLVVKLAYEYRRAYRNMMDLIQEGNMGLMQAVKKYDPYRGVKLSSYAAWWIRAYMLRYILANWRMVKLGTTQAQRKLFFNLNKEKARLSAMGIEPTHEEIARQLDVTAKEVEEMDKRMARSDASLDTPVNESEGRQVARVELLPAPGEQPDMVTESAELGEMLREHLSEFRKGLAGKDLIIFDERLVADDPRTLQDLGDQFGVSRERVRQLEARMTGKLREYLSERMGDPISVGG